MPFSQFQPIYHHHRLAVDPNLPHIQFPMHLDSNSDSSQHPILASFHYAISQNLYSPKNHF